MTSSFRANLAHSIATLALALAGSYDAEPIDERSAVEQFIEAECFHVPGEAVLFSDFYQRFQDWLSPDDCSDWSRVAVSRALPARHPCAAMTANQKFIGNIAFAPAAPAKPFAYIKVDGKLRKAF